MRHQNSVFHGLTKHIPWAAFARNVDKHQADKRARSFFAKDHLLTLLFGQLSGARSLRAIEAGLASHASRLYHLGTSPVPRTTLADANARRPWQLFADLFQDMLPMATRGVRRKMAHATRLLDSTKIKLSPLSEGWARFSENHVAAKLHVVLDSGQTLPVMALVTADNVNDITVAKDLEIAPGMTYVFDLAYYDYAWWAELDAAGCRFVTRLKRFTEIAIECEHAVAEGSHILSDRIGRLPERQARSRRNPFVKPVREIAVRISSGKTIRLVTNDLEAPAEEIAELYKERWQIELFFKWIKQNLEIGHFLGASENAVRIQLFAALIAYLLLHLAYLDQKGAIQRLSAFAHLVRLNLMHRRPIDSLHAPPEPAPRDPRQMPLELHS